MKTKRRMHRGCLRVMVHIVLFAVLGIAVLALGLQGTHLLNEKLESSASVARNAVYKDKTNGVEGVLKGIMLEHCSDSSLINNKVISAKRSTVNKILDDMSEPSDEARLNMAVDTYLAKAVELISKDDAAAAQELENAVNDAREAIIAQLISAADEASASYSKADMKAEMSSANTENYILIYYAGALTVAGAIMLGIAALLTLLWFVKDEDGRAALGNAIEPFDYLMPFMVGVGLFTLYPMVRVLIMSFQENYHLTGNNMGVSNGWGLSNYAFILTGRGSSQFLRSLKNTALYVLFTVPITAVIAIITAYLLNRKSRLNPLFQTAYFMPMVTTATAVGLVWRWLFNQKNGLINAIIAFFTRFTGAPNNINWLQTGATNHAIPMTVLIIFGIWSSLPFTIILLLSGLQNIDENLYTVAKVDGSKPARIFFKITVPLLSPTIGLVLIINSISAFKVYTDVFVLWSGQPDSYQMESVAWYIYNNITAANDGMHSLGVAAAAAMVLFVIIFAFTMIQKLIQRKWVYQ